MSAQAAASRARLARCFDRETILDQRVEVIGSRDPSEAFTAEPAAQFVFDE